MISNRGVIFDMDGVIIDSEPIYYQSNQVVFEKLGIDMPFEIYEQYMGMSAPKMWSQVKQNYQLTHSVDDLVQLEKKHMVAALLETDLEPINGLNNLLDKLRSHAIPLALASSSSRRVIGIITEKLNLTSTFKVLISGQDVSNGKPAPDIFHKAAASIEVSPEKCLVIEDSTHGVRAAKSAGMICVGYLNPNSGQQDLSLADLIISSYSKQSIAQIFDFLT